MTEKQLRPNVIPIVFAIDSNCVAITHVAIQSIIDNASADYYYQFHILYENLTEEDQLSFQRFQGKNYGLELNYIAKSIKRYAKIMHYKYYGSKAIYYRVFIPELLPQYDKVIYLDADVVLNADIAEFYNYDLGDNLVGGVKCAIVNAPEYINYARRFLGLKGKQACYFNSGVLLMNAAKMRYEDFIEQFFELASNFKLEACPDQDYYNLLCYGRTLQLPWCWNKMPAPNSHQKLATVKLVHFNVLGKPWRQKNVKYEELFWQHAQQTIMYQRLLQMREDYLREHPEDNRVAAILSLVKDLSKQDENLLAVVQKKYSEYKIPKKIHYIWLGGQPMSQKCKDCMATWKLHCPDYEIIGWNELNFDMNQSPILQQAMAEHNYTLASAIMRVLILKEHGGIYLDTDVKILKPLDRFLFHEFFIGYEKRFEMGGAIVGGVPQHPVFQVLSQLVTSRRALKLNNLLTSHMWSAVMVNHYQVTINGRTRFLNDEIGIYSKKWFYPLHYLTHKIKILPNTYTIHYYATERVNTQKIRNSLKKFAWIIDAPFYFLWRKYVGIRSRHRVQRLIRLVKRDTKKMAAKVYVHGGK